MRKFFNPCTAKNYPPNTCKHRSNKHRKQNRGNSRNWRKPKRKNNCNERKNNCKNKKDFFHNKNYFGNYMQKNNFCEFFCEFLKFLAFLRIFL